MRDKLIELISAGQVEFLEMQARDDDPQDWDMKTSSEVIADRLIENGVTIQRWIPVSERLPDKNEIVLFFGNTNGKVYRGRYAFTGRSGTVCFAVRGERSKETIYGGTTHWMPLPEPPKEEV